MTGSAAACTRPVPDGGPTADAAVPYVDQCQALAHEGAPIMVPATQEALDARNATFREYAARFAG